MAFRASILSLALASLAAGPATAATFVVNNTGNGADASPGNGVCATGGGVCTLLAAIQETNALPGADVINFNIAGAGPHTISPTSTSLLIVTSQVTIDGTTEPDYATLGYPAIEISGAVAGANNSGITLNFASSSNSIIRGLAINRFNGAGIYVGPDSSSSSSNVIDRCHIGTDAAGTTGLGNGQHGIELRVGSNNNVIGGALGVSGNVVSGNGVDGIRIFGSTGNRVIGNIVGLDRTGTVEIGNTWVGVTVGVGSTNTNVGEAGTGRNIISGNDQHGVRIVDPGTNNNRVQNNYIGVDITGTLERGNGGGAFGGDGIRLEAGGAASGNVIGGSAGGLGNVISGNRAPQGAGILVLNSVTGTLIQGNVIGRSWDGSAAIPNFGPGIRIDNSSNHTVGGSGANEPNLIASNGGPGITVTATATGNRFQQNSTFANGGLGIDLNLDGVTPNDIDDLDTGPNGLQNFVVLSAAQTNGAGSVNVAGSLNNSPSSTFRVEFFAGTASDPSGYGEGERYLGFQNVATDVTGNAVFGVTLAASVVAGEVVTATVTSSTNSTSEFSAAVTAVGSLIVTTTADTVDGTTTSVANLIAAPGADGRISLREAIQATNATVGADTIRFGIPLTDANRLYYQDDATPGSLSLVAATTRADLDVTDFDPDYPGTAFSWFRIRPGSALPTIGEAVVLDGYTQPGARANSVAAPGVSDAILKVLLDGSLVGGGVNGIRISSGGSTVRGLVVNQFSAAGLGLITGGGNAVEGCYLGTDPTGTIALGNRTGVDIRLGSNGNTIGGTTPAVRNLLSGNQPEDGVYIQEAANNLVQGNYIGTDVTGTAALGNANRGVQIDNGGSFNVIGGTAPGAGNVVSGNGSDGVIVADFSLFGTTGNVIQGNYIGTEVTGTLPLGNVSNGVNLGPVANTTIGGGGAGAGNVIAHNSLRGVRLDPAALTGNSILGNSIHSNAGLGIDLSSNGVTANDAGDVDTGPNDLLNWPFIYGVVESGGTLAVDFALDVPAGSYRIEFFRNPLGADGSGNGEGQVFASALTLTHAGAGTESFSHSFSGSPGEVVTATTTFCTDGATCAAFGNTSEFGKAFTEGVTAVELLSFEASGLEGAVELTWKTASELKNLGFHLYRARSPSGPFERITEALIPGLGSSPSGASYRRRDSGLTNGVTYFYELEDVEATGRTMRHGPVSATPGDRDDARKTYGDPSEVSLRILERSARGVLLELVTGGFYATDLGDGTFRLEVPGFEEAGGIALPVKRTWLEASAGRGVRISGIEALELTTLAGLAPSSGGAPEIVATPEGTVRAGWRRGRGRAPGADVIPASAARVVEIGFQQEAKKALIELAPLRWDPGQGRLLWARRLRVRVSFASPESRDRRHRERRSHGSRRVLMQLSTDAPGLYRMPLDDALLARGELRLGRLGEPVPYHLGPNALYFLGERNAVYELESGSGGITMPVETSPPSGLPVSSYLHRQEWQEDRYYQAGLLEAPTLWLWDLIVSPASKSFPFTLGSLLEGEAVLELHLQGASFDHQVRLLVNGSTVGEVSWKGKTPKAVELPLATGALREGENELTIENLGGAEASYSMVFLDRFSVAHPRRPVLDAGSLSGLFRESGTVSLGERSFVLQTAPRTAWLEGLERGSFHVEAGRSYLAVSPEAVLEPRVRTPTGSSLRSLRNRADYLLIAPREFLPAAEPLLRLRRSQKLVSRAVAVEEVYDEFGYGEARAEAVKEFLEYAYHHWQKPSVRYVLLLGDATYDHEDHLKTGVRNHVPTPIRKTSYLWTASDPSYASVNGEDGLPDLALGRLPAASVEEARALVEKLLSYEKAELDLSGSAVLVADDPDAAGDFERDSDEIASRLEGSQVEKIYLRLLGRSRTRSAILESLDQGASLLSYVGHGGIALWASENLFESRDVEALGPQSRQPILMTMNCLNGYFHFPYFDSLAEAFVKAEGKGAIAAFSPSGLSLNAPAHLYQLALVDELTSNRHARLGDAVLAAQSAYAESGAFPELLAIYHLFGDPALRLPLSR